MMNKTRMIENFNQSFNVQINENIIPENMVWNNWKSALLCVSLDALMKKAQFFNERRKTKLLNDIQEISVEQWQKIADFMVENFIVLNAYYSESRLKHLITCGYLYQEEACNYLRVVIKRDFWLKDNWESILATLSQERCKDLGNWEF